MNIKHRGIPGLRLFAPVPGTLDRLVPKGGLDVHGFHLSEGTSFGMQAYSVHRDPTIWDEPEGENFLVEHPATVKQPIDLEKCMKPVFKPERWLEPSPEMTVSLTSHGPTRGIEANCHCITLQAAFIPFSIGSRNCPGMKQVQTSAQIRAVANQVHRVTLIALQHRLYRSAAALRNHRPQLRHFTVTGDDRRFHAPARHDRD